MGESENNMFVTTNDIDNVDRFNHSSVLGVFI